MLNIVSICISAVALVVAIYSVVYTQYLNRFALIVCDAYNVSHVGLSSYSVAMDVSTFPLFS